MDTYRLLHLRTTAQMWNEAFAEHLRFSPNCSSGFLNWDIEREVKVGLCWREGLGCSKCQYKSKLYKLYEELPCNTRGRRPAKLNRGLHVGLSQTSIGPASLAKILCSINTPPPSIHGMQKSANEVLSTIKKENEIDMLMRCQGLRLLNTFRGKNPASVNVQADGCYNNSLYSGVGKTPFQPSTQAIYLFAENETDRNQIINLQTISKLCSKRRNGLNIECHHVGKCFANIPMATSIGNEEQWAKQGLLDLSGAGLEAEFITTDPDSSAYRAAMTLYDDGITNIEPSHLLDTRHITQNHRKFVKNMAQLTALMPGRTKIERQKTQNKFAIDLAARCQAEFNQAFRKYRKNVPKLKSVLSYTCDSVVECYHGNHALCNTYSFVCMAETNTTWLQRSHYLRADFRVKPCGDSLAMLRKCVEYRLGQGMLEKTRLNTNTQKCEAANRSFRRSLPKYLTFTRNFSGRSHSAAHNINNGPGESVFKLCRAVGSSIHEGFVEP